MYRCGRVLRVLRVQRLRRAAAEAARCGAGLGRTNGTDGPTGSQFLSGLAKFSATHCSSMDGPVDNPVSDAAPDLPQFSASPAAAKPKRIISDRQREALARARAAKAAKASAAQSAVDLEDPMDLPEPVPISSRVDPQRKRKRDEDEPWVPEWKLNFSWGLLGATLVTVGLAYYSVLSRKKSKSDEPQELVGLTVQGWRNLG